MRERAGNSNGPKVITFPQTVFIHFSYRPCEPLAVRLPPFNFPFPESTIFMGEPLFSTRLPACDWEWKLEAPPRKEGGKGKPPQWLLEAQAFRAIMFFADASRKGSVMLDGDPLDPESFHILARLSGKLVGCVRMTFGPGRSRGQSFFEELGFRDAGSWPDEVFEGPIASRWATFPGQGGLALALRLAAGCYALARSFGQIRVHAATATASGQDRILMRCGAQPALELGGRVLASQFRQATYMLRMDVSAAKPTFEGLIHDMGERLCLPAPKLRKAA